MVAESIGACKLSASMKTPLLAALAVCIAASAADPAASIPAAQSPAASPRLVSSRDGLVVSASPFASDIGASILTSGGNAVDAACATAFALAVTYPFAGNIGGGGFMIVRRPNGKTAAIDYRETAPARSTPTMYLDDEGNIDR